MLDVIKKTLFVTNDFGPRTGGIESFIIGLIEHLPYGSTTVYTSSQADTRAYDATWLESYGVRIIRDRAKILLPTPRIARRVGAFIRKEQIEVVAFGAAAPLGLLAPSLRRAGAHRIIALTHGHELWWSKVFPFTVAIRRIGSTLDLLTYLGRFTGDAIARSLTPAAASAMVKIAPGIDTEHFRPMDSSQLRESLGLGDKKVIVCVARLVHRKGQDQLIAAMPVIIKDVPDAHLLLIGEGPYRSHLQSLVKKYELEGYVSFIGRIQYADLPRYLSLGNIFAMPARSRFFGLEVEGLGIVYLEASACGLPVIAGASGGAPDAVVQGRTGVVVDGLDKAVIAAAAINMLTHPELCQEMGRTGREWVVEKWRWQIWADKFAALIND